MTDLFATTDVDADSLAPLRARLAAAAAEDGLLDVGYRTVDTPLGALLVAATERGVVRVAFATEDHDAELDLLARDISPRVLRAPSRIDPVARQLDDYFAGRRRHFDVPVDLRMVSGFRRDVIERIATIEYGTTWTYADLARSTGRPAAVRAVGTACGRNPVPVIVPCHRVVRSDGTTGQYRGGPEAKVSLLSLEAR
jgi:methylated-DNA-[protein]-cysteine S-methyltransferase